MYVPAHFAASADAVRDLLDRHGAADLQLVRRLTAQHEVGSSPRPWSVDDAPAGFIAGQLRAIVGVELVISRIEAKAKLSQNRPEADVDGVIAGLRDRGDTGSADAVAQARLS